MDYAIEAKELTKPYALEGKTLYGPVLDSVVLLLFTAVFLFIGMRLDKKFRK